MEEIAAYAAEHWRPKQSRPAPRRGRVRPLRPDIAAETRAAVERGELKVWTPTDPPSDPGTGWRRSRARGAPVHAAVAAKWRMAVMHENVCSCRPFGFCLTEHDPERLWIVKGTEHRTVELEDGINVFAWAHERWPEPRWSVELDAWPLGRDWPRW